MKSKRIRKRGPMARTYFWRGTACPLGISPSAIAKGILSDNHDQSSAINGQALRDGRPVFGYRWPRGISNSFAADVKGLARLVKMNGRCWLTPENLQRPHRRAPVCH